MAGSRRRGRGATPRDLAGGRGNFGLRLPPSVRLRLPARPCAPAPLTAYCACAWGGAARCGVRAAPLPALRAPLRGPPPRYGQGSGHAGGKTLSPRRRRLWHCRRRRCFATLAPLRGTRRRRQAARRRRGWGYEGGGSAYGTANACPAAQKRYRQPCEVKERKNWRK